MQRSATAATPDIGKMRHLLVIGRRSWRGIEQFTVRRDSNFFFVAEPQQTACENRNTSIGVQHGGWVKKLFLSGCVFGALIISAAAADMPLKAVPNVPPAWTGLYAGLNAGYADLQSSAYPVASGTPDAALGMPPGVSDGLAVLSSRTIPLGSGAGFAGGGQIGYNLQFNRLLVGGIEADIQGVAGRNSGSITTGSFVLGVPITTTQTAKVSTTYLGTVRGRLGILLTPSWLIYATGGLAYGGS
ncbi:MAG TPA: hypothetical protein VGP86_15570, partial [Xanthobacteraceae bacterium]|nr:hypothetical protein [Xanthobacteraceae bacterium]